MQKKQKKEKDDRQARLKKNVSGIKNIILVMSGKGGVGKTTVSVSIACGLAKKGFTIGVLDVDIHGPNIAKMFGIENTKMVVSERGIEPVNVAADLKAVSIAMMLEEKNKAVIWRGPLKMVTIKQFLSDVHWGELDYLIVDSPPGTGDEPLSVCQLLPSISGVIIVTTPQEVALLDSRKAINFTRELGVPLIGVVENMSGFTCPYCNRSIPLFGTGGGEYAATQMGAPFLGSIPIDPDIVRRSDAGKPLMSVSKQTPSRKAFDRIIDKIHFYIKGKSGAV